MRWNLDKIERWIDRKWIDRKYIDKKYIDRKINR